LYGKGPCQNIEGIMKPAIQTLVRKGGVKRITGFIYEETRGSLEKSDSWCSDLDWTHQEDDSDCSESGLCPQQPRKKPSMAFNFKSKKGTFDWNLT